jgi:hypothetical protein
MLSTPHRVYSPLLPPPHLPLPLSQRTVGVNNHRALCAFVTFEDPVGFVRCLDLYPDNAMQRLLQPTALRFKGRRIKVFKAPEPSIILWENLSTSKSVCECVSVCVCGGGE